MNVLDRFIEMTKNSWTYERMTTEEKNNCIETLKDIRTINSLKYLDNHKWDVLQAVYGAYLKGLGYDGFEWREQ